MNRILGLCYYNKKYDMPFIRTPVRNEKEGRAEKVVKERMTDS